MPGDVVPADRGFDIAESVGFYYAEVKIPAFTKRIKQLSGANVESTQRITSVWTHVERVIGLFRNKYRTLQRILPVDYLITKDGGSTTVNKIVTVSSALCNICNSIVPIEQFLLLSLHIYCKQNNQLIIFNMECKMEVVASLLLTHT